MTPQQQSLADVPLFRDLPDSLLDSLASKARWMRARKHQVILSHTDLSTDVFIPITGSLRVQIYSPNGKLITLRDAYQGELIGELSAIDGQPRSASVVAKSDCMIAILTAESLKSVLRVYPVLMERLLLQLAQRVREMTSRVFEMAMLDVKGRILSEVWRISLRGRRLDEGLLVKPAPTHEMIAHQVGTHREAVTRTLNWLETEGIIQKRRGEILVIQEERLAQMVDDLMGYRVSRTDGGSSLAV